MYLLAADEEQKSHINPADLYKFAKKIYVIQSSKFSRLMSVLMGYLQSTPFQVKWFSHFKIKKKFPKILQEVEPDYIFCHTVRMADLLKGYQGSAKLIIDYQDAFGLNMEKRINSEPFWFKPLIKLEAKRLKDYENQIFECFQKHIIISENDAQNIIHPKSNEIAIIANGVEFPKILVQDKKIDFLFVGNMSYLPNIEAVIFFAKDIFPEILKSNPTSKFYIVGNEPTSKVKELGNENIIITGWVDDVNEYYQKAKIFVAPMLISTGLQNKILEAMANQVPCLISESANLALNAQHNHSVITANNREEFIQQSLLLLNNPSWRNKIAENGKKFVENHYSWDAIGEQLTRLFKNIGS